MCPTKGSYLIVKTERVGFEPTAPYGDTGFRGQLLKPLGHLSISSVSQNAIVIISVKGEYVKVGLYFFRKLQI